MIDYALEFWKDLADKTQKVDSHLFEIRIMGNIPFVAPATSPPLSEPLPPPGGSLLEWR